MTFALKPFILNTADQRDLRTVSYQFAAGDQKYNGHFVGQPIVPGAALVDILMRFIAASHPPGYTLAEISHVKFFLPVRPGDKVIFRWRENDVETDFECVFAANEKRVLTGSARWSSMKK